MFINRPAISNEAPTEVEIIKQQDAELKSEFKLIRDAVQKEMVANSSNNASLSREELKVEIEDCFNQVLEDKNILYNHATRLKMLDMVIADIIGYGPIEPLLRDPEITEVMVNGYNSVFIERFGLLEKTNVKFENDAHVMRVIERIVSPLGRRVDESSPMVDARLPSGYRVNAAIPPLAIDGPALTIRKFAKDPYTVQDLIAFKTMSEATANFLKACVEARINLIVSGGTGTGKTTFLNVLSSFIPADERVITIEDTAELQLKQEHVVRLEKRPPNVEGKGEITIRQLVINALRMRPDRIVVGECRSSETLDMLQAMNTGHDGSMTTVHSNGPRDTLRRIETMVLMAGMELPLKAIREQVAGAVELVVHLERVKDGSRKVTNVSEVQGMEGDTIVMQDVFEYNQTGIKNGRVQGVLKPTGLRPKFLSKMTANNIKIPDSVFEK